MRLLVVIAIVLLHSSVYGQATISGKVKDNKGRPVAGASIAVKDTYDGATSDSSGSFKFRTSEKGQQTLLTSSIGYRLSEQKIEINGSSLQLDIILKEEPSELKAVV